jgi:hypothetical protein
MLAAAATTLDEGLGSAMAETVTEREAASAHDAGYLAGAAKTLDVVAELAAANELSEQHLADKLAETAKYWQREMAKLERRISKWVAKQRRAAKALRKLRARLDYAAAQLSDTSAAERRSISRRRRP